MNANINFTIRNNTHKHMKLMKVKRPVGRRYGKASPLPFSSRKHIIKTPNVSKFKVGSYVIPDPYSSMMGKRRYALLSPLMTMTIMLASFMSAAGLLVFVA